MSKTETNPLLLLATAVSFEGDARLIEKGSSEEFRPAIFLLASYAIEVALKAYILDKTAQQSKLKSLGHNLESCFKEARGLGFKVDTLKYKLEDIERILSEIQVAHRENYMRYLPSASTLKLPTAFNLLEITATIISAVREQTNISSS